MCCGRHRYGCPRWAAGWTTTPSTSWPPRRPAGTPPGYSASTAAPHPRRGRAGLHAGDEFLDPVVDGAERVLAQDRALGLVVELEVHPVDGEVAAALLRAADELAA